MSKRSKALLILAYFFKCLPVAVVALGCGTLVVACNVSLWDGSRPGQDPDHLLFWGVWAAIVLIGLCIWGFAYAQEHDWRDP